MYQSRGTLIKDPIPRSIPRREQATPAPPQSRAPQTVKTRPRLLVRVGLLSLVILVCLGIFIGLVAYSPLATVLGGGEEQAQTSATKPPAAPPTVQPTQKPSELNEQMKATATTKLHAFEGALAQVQQTGKDVADYQKRLRQYRTQLAALSTRHDYIAFLIQLGSDLASMQQDVASNQPQVMLDQFKDETRKWGDAHLYHNPFDKQDYYLNSSYLSMDGHNGYLYGETAYLTSEVQSYYPQVMQDIKDDYFLHEMLEANYEDTTPYNKPHQVDQSLLDYYGLQHTHVLLVSLTEQAMRVYRDGQLEQSLLVTTGRVYRPTPAGHFNMSTHYENLTLTSYDAPGTPDYYTPVMVRDAIQFWDNGYLVHSSQWRKDYGPMTQFPHQDSGGDPEAKVGSHGCINVAPNLLRALAPTITAQTHLIIF